MPEGSPLSDSGIQQGDRILWADGELIFSMEQLSYLLNDGRALLTIQRGNETFLTRVPRVSISDLMLPFEAKEEMRDWQFEANLKSKIQRLLFIPYAINTEAIVEGPLNFIDEESRRSAFPFHRLSKSELPLVTGDKLLP